MANTYNRISHLVNSQVPFFVRNDHRMFVTFLEHYYRYLEQQDKAIGRLKNLQAYRDIDRTTDEFSEYIYSEFIKLIPEEAVVDKSLILKNIKDFYRSRGTEKSIRFLLRIIFGDLADSVTFYYPKKDVLRVSDGKWFIEKSIKIENVKINGVANNNINGILKFEGTRIKGNTSNATALVERLETYYENDILVRELKISNQVRDFELGEQIWANFDENGTTKLITANTFSGVIGRVAILKSGTNYQIGDQVVIESNTGTGGIITVTRVTEGGISSIGVIDGGAGFKKDDNILLIGGSGLGANAKVGTVNTNSILHPNSYNIIIDLISYEANTPIGNAVYSNLVNSISDPANSAISNSLHTFVYSNCGPVLTVTVVSEGNNYVTLPTADIVANTRIRELGILGAMSIDNAGTGYTTNDWIEITNVTGGLGVGAFANVTRVNANGSIQEVRFQQMSGHVIGGAGYSQDYLPTANVVTTTGSNAVIRIKSVLGDGENLISFAANVGSIRELTIQSRGSGYTSAPTLNLQSIGDGTAQAAAFIITGVFEYPGRYINDDGKISGFNFIQDEHYYQSFSYVVRTKVSIEKYRNYLKKLTHPAGMKMFGEYLFDDQAENESNADFQFINTETASKMLSATYVASGRPSTNSTNVVITLGSGRTITTLRNNIYFEVVTSNNANKVANGIYLVLANTSNTINVRAANTNINANGSLIVILT